MHLALVTNCIDLIAEEYMPYKNIEHCSENLKYPEIKSFSPDDLIFALTILKQNPRTYCFWSKLFYLPTKSFLIGCLRKNLY